MLHDVGNNRDCDVDVDHRNNTSYYYISLFSVRNKYTTVVICRTVRRIILDFAINQTKIIY